MNVEKFGYHYLQNDYLNQQKDSDIQILVKISNVRIHTLLGSGQFDEKTNSIGF